MGRSSRAELDTVWWGSEWPKYLLRSRAGRYAGAITASEM